MSQKFCNILVVHVGLQCLYHVTQVFQVMLGGCPHGVMAKAMVCGIVVSEFVLHLCYYVHFWANSLGKGTNPLILPAMD